MQIVIAHSKVPPISEFILDLKIGLLGVSVGKLAFHKPQLAGRKSRNHGQSKLV